MRCTADFCHGVGARHSRPSAEAEQSASSGLACAGRGGLTIDPGAVALLFEVVNSAARSAVQEFHRRMADYGGQSNVDAALVSFVVQCLGSVHYHSA